MLRKIRELLKCQKGFTLVELMAVIAIIGVLAAIAIPRFSESTKEAEAAKILADLRTIDSAIAMYYSNHGEYPEYNTDDLVTAPNTYLAALPTPPAGAYSINANTHIAEWTRAGDDAVARNSATPKGTIRGDL